jgi:hypothetical protein
MVPLATRPAAVTPVIESTACGANDPADPWAVLPLIVELSERVGDVAEPAADAPAGRMPRLLVPVEALPVPVTPEIVPLPEACALAA